MKTTLAFALLPAAAVRAAYPDELEWTETGLNSMEGHLEFCEDGSNHGYRALGDTTACGSKPGPLLSMSKGTVYKLWLHNTASSGTFTNMHTHGLHIPGSGNADDVTRHVDGGECLEYEWDIASDHPDGTYWYHPHYHGTTKGQVSAGAFGMIVVKNDSNDGVNDWAYNDRLLQIWDPEQGPNIYGNGHSAEEILVNSGDWYRLRVSAVSPKAQARALTFGAACTVYKVASDGIWHNAALTTYSGSSFIMTGASRADFAIKCSSGSTSIMYGGALAATINAGSHGTLYDGAPSTEDIVNDLGSAPSRPESLAFDSTDTDTVYPRETKIELNGGGLKVNNAVYSAMSGVEPDVEYGYIHEWTLGPTNIHPFHLHLYHMLVVSGCDDHHTVGEFYDTIASSSECVVRFKAWDIGQKMVFHCHFLQHEDNGAINYMNVAGTIPHTNTNNGAATACPSMSSQSSTTSPTAMPSLAPTENPTGGGVGGGVTSPPSASPTAAPTSSCVGSNQGCAADTDCCDGRLCTSMGPNKKCRNVRRSISP